MKKGINFHAGYGFHTDYGYRGKVNGRWMLFATEQEYKDYIKEHDEKS